MASLKDLIVMGPARFLDKLYGNLEGNAATATKLQTPRAINGTNFDGSAAITTTNWGTARTITIGNTEKSVNGSTNYSWTHAEIGTFAAVADSNGYYCIAYPDKSTSNWLRTTQSGIIPYKSGGSSALGTSSWPFNSIHSNYGYFGGTSTNTYALNTSSFICDSWVRTKGETGWYNETYGGGWYMEDSTWVRAYNGKKVRIANDTYDSLYTTGGVNAKRGFFGSDNESMSIRPENSNEINFGGTSNSTTIYIGYRSADSRGIPTNFIFGGAAGSATLTASSFTGLAAKATADSDGNTISSTYLKKSGGTMTGHLYATSGLTWYNATWQPVGNINCAPTANNQEWSIDVGNSSYTGSYFHIWSGKNQASILQCFVDDNRVVIPSGTLTASKMIYADGGITGNLSGNATTATKATQDGSGNTITSTYLKLSGGTMTGYLTGRTANTSWIGTTRLGAFRTETASSGGSANSVISMKTSGGAWGIANLTGSDNLYFVFGTDTNYNAGTNSTKNYYINTDGHFSGTCSYASSAGAVAWGNISGKPSFNYLPLTGGSVTGAISITTNGVTNSFYSQNGSYTHYSTNASVGHWFNKAVYVQGEIYAGSSYNQRVYHMGNVIYSSTEPTAPYVGAIWLCPV